MTKSRLFWGTILLIIGLLLLFSNLGIIAIEIWSAIWAVLLIVVGLGILYGVFSGREAPGQEVAIPLEGAARATIHLSHGAGRLRVDAGAPTDALLEGTFGGGLDYRSDRKGDQLNVHLSPPDLLAMMVPWNWGREGLGWLLRLNGEIPLSLAFETGASDARLDLTDLRVTDLKLETGASSLNVTLPAQAGHTRARIDAGAASVAVRIPAQVAARLRLEGGLASIEVDEARFPRAGRLYQSPNYETAENRIDLKVEAGVGSLRVR